MVSWVNEHVLILFCVRQNERTTGIVDQRMKKRNQQ